MSLEKILERFAQLAGFSREEALPWQGLCQEAMEELSAKARYADRGESLLNAAGAALAFYRYSLFQSCGPESSFSAGEIKITKDFGGIRAAKQLWLDSYRAAVPYLRDDTFSFYQVRS